MTNHKKNKKIKVSHNSQLTENTGATGSEVIELVPDEKWNLWLKTLTDFIMELDGVINVLELLGHIKNMIESFSRSYTAMWTLDTLLECWKNNESQLDISFKSSIDRLQREWTYIYDPIKEQRKQLLATKCIQFFKEKCKDRHEIVSDIELQMMTENTTTPNDLWVAISKIAHDKGWTSKPSYKHFLGQLVIEMAKY